MKKSTKKEIDKVINQIVKNYKPEKIILFGSFSHGKPTLNSDVDLFIVKNETKKDPLQRCYELRKILDSPFPLDILIYSSKEIKQRINFGDFFLKEIIKQGKLLYEKQ